MSTECNVKHTCNNTSSLADTADAYDEEYAYGDDSAFGSSGTSDDLNQEFESQKANNEYSISGQSNSGKSTSSKSMKNDADLFESLVSGNGTANIFLDMPVSTDMSKQASMSATQISNLDDKPFDSYNAAWSHMLATDKKPILSQESTSLRHGIQEKISRYSNMKKFDFAIDFPSGKTVDVSIDNAHETCMVSFQTADIRLREDLLSSQSQLAEEIGMDMGTNVEIKVV